MSESFSEKNILAPVSSFVPLLLMGLIVGFLPTIIYLFNVQIDDVAQLVYGQRVSLNYFSYYKSLWLYLLTFGCLFWFVFKGTCEACWQNWALAVFSFFAIASTLFSQHPVLALKGDPLHFEGLFVQLCYMALVFLFMNVVRTRAALKSLLTVLFISAIFLSAVGLSQFFLRDRIPFDPILKFLAPSHLSQAIGETDMSDFKNDSSHNIFLTFGNGNIVGSYMAMLCVLSFVFLFAYESRAKSVFFLINLLFYVILLGSKSRAGFWAAAISVTLSIVFLRQKIVSKFGLFLLLLFFYTSIPFVFDAYTLRQGLPRFFDTAVSRSAITKTGPIGHFKNLILNKDSAEVDFDGRKLLVKFVDTGIELYDDQGELIPNRLVPISLVPKAPKVDIEVNTLKFFEDRARKSSLEALQKMTQEQTEKTTPNLDLPTVAVFSHPVASATSGKPDDKEYKVIFPPDRLRGYNIHAWPNSSVLRIDRGGVYLFVCHTDEGVKLLDHLFRPVAYNDVIKEVDTLGFDGYEKLFSSRGYIWARSLPLLKQTILIGFGPDTFIMHYPNNDYLGKLRFVLTGILRVIDKPHNMYLQIAINTGLVSLVALMVLFFGYLADTIKILRNDSSDSFISSASLGVGSAVFAYLIAGLFNDSAISVAPVFWSLLGLGFAANRMALKQASSDNGICQAESVSAEVEAI